MRRDKGGLLGGVLRRPMVQEGTGYIGCQVTQALAAAARVAIVRPSVVVRRVDCLGWQTLRANDRRSATNHQREAGHAAHSSSSQWVIAWKHASHKVVAERCLLHLIGSLAGKLDVIRRIDPNSAGLLTPHEGSVGPEVLSGGVFWTSWAGLTGLAEIRQMGPSVRPPALRRAADGELPVGWNHCPFRFTRDDGRELRALGTVSPAARQTGRLLYDRALLDKYESHRLPQCPAREEVGREQRPRREMLRQLRSAGPRSAAR